MSKLVYKFNPKFYPKYNICPKPTIENVDDIYIYISHVHWMFILKPGIKKNGYKH
jgi:hypothetical protein